MSFVTQFSQVDPFKLEHSERTKVEDGPVVYPTNVFDSRLRGD